MMCVHLTRTLFIQSENISYLLGMCCSEDACILKGCSTFKENDVNWVNVIYYLSPQ